ncbi:MAG: alpha/beta fold hydrolase [Candidatus Nanopelagicales bacterium]|nr:alpha/beta fold hydrolase [Candidatus Nanopelagicales bacterium]
MNLVESASLPPAGLPGLDPSWSRLANAPDHSGRICTWHLLDSYAQRSGDVPRLTLVCVHGNPTWSYLWRRLVQLAPADVRVVAMDQLEMGFSERTGDTRRLADRVADLSSLTEALGITGPVVTVAHDWGGPISLGWAQRHLAQLAGVVLLNTAVHQPVGGPAPALIRLARSGPLLNLNTVHTSAFLRGTTALSGSKMSKQTAKAFRAPYTTSQRRVAIGDFVADIPLETEHPSAKKLDLIAADMTEFEQVPMLLLWGPGDPVFSDLYLGDLMTRAPHADVHRYEGARHLVSEDDERVFPDLLRWVANLALEQRTGSNPGAGIATQQVHRTRLWDGLHEAAERTPTGVAIVEMSGAGRRVTWRRLADTVDQLAAGLHASGVNPGDRVSLLIPPGADLIAAVYACWRIGAGVVIADAGLGIKGMRRAIRGAAPDHVIAIRSGLALARTLRIPGLRLSVKGLAAIARIDAPMPPEPSESATAVIVFTSGATGPAKGVVYRQSQVAGTRDVLREHYVINPSDAIVAAFAPWAVFGPTLGVASVIPDMDVTKPRTLQAVALAEATAAVAGTLLWASPAALTNVIVTAGALSAEQRRSFDSLRLVLGAGAPVPLPLLEQIHELVPHADIRTPYGMTEVLPVSEVNLPEIRAAAGGNGVLVGRPVNGVEVMISALDADGRPVGELTDQSEVTGEICVKADHMRDRYDRLWATNYSASRDSGWHRTGDVGHLDSDGRLWVEGRLAHLIVTARGPVTPVGIEQRVQQLPFVQWAAAVGIGPSGNQLPIVIVTSTDGTAEGLLDVDSTQMVRDQIPELDIAAVLVRDELPVDIRHNSKIDRKALSFWADQILAGHR